MQGRRADNRANRPGPYRRGCALLLAALAPGLIAASPALAAGPTVASTWATAVTATSASLHAEVNPQGQSTTYRFEYISQAAFQANVESGHEGFLGAARAPSSGEAGLGNGTNEVLAVQQVNSLATATSYEYRVVARSSGGTTTGPTRSFTTQATSGRFLRLDNRGWEMVSPVDKNGGAIQGPGGNFGGDVLQAAEQGGAITYSSGSSFGEAPQGAPPASQYISRRTEAGWHTENITAPTVSGSYGAEPNGVPYQLFASDLARGLMLNGVHCRSGTGACPVANPPLPGSGAPAGYQDYYLRDSEGGGYVALVTTANAELSLSAERFDLAFVGASPDLRHVILSTCAALVSGATEVPVGEGCDPSEPNLYEYSEGQLSLVNVAPGAAVAARLGAVADDGGRVYFDEGGNLYLREGGSVKQVDGEVGGGGTFQAATPSGAFAFFTKAGHLYRYEAQFEDLSTVDLTPSGGVEGVLGVSDDGSRVYYATSSGLYLWHAGATSLIAAGAGVADAGDFLLDRGTARVSGDGTRLVFLSEASLTGYDNVSQASGQPVPELFLYGATSGHLTCLSCNPTGERPLGGSRIPGTVPNGEAPGSTDYYRPRVLVAGGDRVFFDSADSLVPLDTNNHPDVYEWEAGGIGECAEADGCIALVSSGRGEDGASFVDASADGNDVYFLTAESLVSADPGSADVYDARVNGGFPESPPPIECVGDSCQPLPQAPEDPTVGTSIPGPPNPKARVPKPSCPKGKHRVTRRGKSLCVAKHHAKRHRGSRR